MVKYNELFRKLKKEGWYVDRQKGSHKIMRHPAKRNIVVLPYHAGKEVTPGVLRKIIKKSGIKFRKR